MFMTSHLADQQAKTEVYKQDIQDRSILMKHNERYIELLQDGNQFAYQAQGSRLAQMAAKADLLRNQDDGEIKVLKTKAYSFTKDTGQAFGTRTNSEQPYV